MKQYNLAFHDEEQTIPCTYIIERDDSVFEGFFLDNSIGTFKDVNVAARALWYITELTLWRPSPDQRKYRI